tara:strand:- start:12061 stop:13377 length:1317 start_codon:yes stop_codon:yes gene_type:complete
MRNSFRYTIKNKEEFAEKLIYWAKKFQFSVFLDSNSQMNKMPPSYDTFDFIYAVGINRLCMPKENFFESLRLFYENNKDWVFGYFTYDLKNEIFNLKSENIDNLYFPEMLFCIPKYVFRLHNKTLIIETFSDKKHADNLINKIKNYIIKRSRNKALEIKRREKKALYLEKINNIKSNIKRGDVYEMNYCQEFYSESAIIDPESMYFNLNEKTKSPFSSFMHFRDKYLLCFSPERFLKKSNKTVISQPIKGTSKRSANVKEDRRLRNDLVKSKKDIAENVMITDLVRNDLSKYACRSSVKVEELCGIYSFNNVHQLITTISSEISNETHFIDVIKGSFPMGSMTGAPKKKALELIEKYETTKRGLFSGSIGYITPDGDFDFNVVIRSILYNKTKKYLSVIAGGAITDQSKPEEEYAESIIKIKNILETVSKKNNSNCET